MRDQVTPVVRAVGLEAGYRDVRALTAVDFQVRPGTRVGIVGPNGAGKSTLVRCLLGLLQPSHGTLTVLGQEPRAARRRVGYLPQRQEVDLTFPARVRDVVGMGRYPHRGPIGRTRPDDRRAIESAMEEVGIGELADQPLGSLSGGLQQRTFLARTLAQEPELLVLDEPYANVDATTCATIDTVLVGLRAAGRAVLVVDHDLDRLNQRYDQVLLLGGRLFHDGPPEGLGADALRRAYAGSALVIDGDGKVRHA